MPLTTYALGAILVLMVEVIATDEFYEWFRGLKNDLRQKIDQIITYLELKGVSLGRPWSGEIKGWNAAFRELILRKPPIRIFYAFDPRRDAVLLLAGDKTGNPRFYEEFRPRVE